MLAPLVVLFTFLYCVQTDPIIIRSGVSSHKDGGRVQDAKVFDLNSAKGVSNFAGEEGYHQDNESKHVLAQDAGKYNEENAQKNLHSNENKFADDKFHKEEGGAIADFNKKSASKKGHHKSGYTKSFRKDESASTSSFYDDSDDEGNQYVQDNKHKAYGDAGQQSHRGSDLDNRKYAQDQGKQGYYNNAGNYGKDAANNRGYHSKQFYDGYENEGRRNVADRYGEGGRYEDEKYLKKDPHYYYDHLPPPPPPPAYTSPKKTITIYEDPRYDEYDQYPPSYDSDYVHLELRRPPRDYDYRDYYRFDNRKPIDYYYY